MCVNYGKVRFVKNQLYKSLKSKERRKRMSQALGEELTAQVEGARVMVVGTGGIGCELLKNLVLSGFRDIVAVSS